MRDAGSPRVARDLLQEVGDVEVVGRRRRRSGGAGRRRPLADVDAAPTPGATCVAAGSDAVGLDAGSGSGSRPPRRGLDARVAGLPPSKPAAMTVTRTSSPSASSMTAPKMMLASGWAASADQLGGLVDLEQAEVGAAGDGEQHAVGAVDAGLEQRAGDRHLGRRDRAVVAAGRADAHERRTGART